MPNHIYTGSRMFGHAGGRTMFRSRAESRDCNMIKYDMQIGSAAHEQLGSNHDFENMPDLGSTVQNFEQGMELQKNRNQNLGIPHTLNTMTTPRHFSSTLSLHQEDNLRLNSIIDSMPQKRNISTVSKTFGLISEEENVLATQNYGRYNSYMNGSGSLNSSVIPRPFGLGITKTLTSQSDGFPHNSSRLNQNKSTMNFRSTMPRNFLDSDSSGGLIRNQNEGFYKNLKRNTVQSSILTRPFDLQSGISVHNSERESRLNQDLTLRSNNTSAFSKNFGSVVRSYAGLNSQEKVNGTYNTDIIENEGFRKPMLSRVIRGRSSISASRLFQNQKIKQHCRDLSNISGYSVSHISSRDIDSQSDSRLLFNPRNNWTDNQSMSGSVLSVTSLKCQFMNLLESLHHSILNVAPQVSTEAVRMEFDRAKQTLENISEMSFASSVKESITASETHQPSKKACPAITKPTTSARIDGGSLNLKSSEDLLQTFFSCKCTNKDKSNSAIHMKEHDRRKSPALSREKADDEESVFKKPKPYIKNKSKRKSSRLSQGNVSNVVEKLKSVAKNKAVDLKEWYPVAVGSNLVLCGINEEGASIETDAVKKRLTFRKVELINGLICNLIGSPSATVSVLPEKVISLLKNGLTNKWRMLQQELLNCQKFEERKIKKRKSKSPSVKGSPIKKKAEDRKVISSSKKKEKVAELRTKSGRIIKPPSMFWVATNSDEDSSAMNRTMSGIINNERSKKTVLTKETPVKATHESSVKTQETVINASPKKKQKYQPVKYSEKKKSKVKNTKKNKTEESEEEEEEETIYPSNEDSKRKNRDQNVQGKRKRDVNGDAESFQAKKSKLEKSIDPEVESSVQASESSPKSRKVIISSSSVSSSRKRQIHAEKTVNESTNQLKKKKSRLALGSRSPKPKGKKSPSPKKGNSKKKTKNKSDRKTETKESDESGEDFELKLDEIEIPEIASVSMNPRLNRSQMRLITETPPLKYFTSHLHLMRSSMTPVKSPDWCISQRTQSEVKQFQKRMEEALKKKQKVNMKKTTTKKETFVVEKNVNSKSVQNRDVKRVMEWVAEKTVRSPSWSSKVLQYVIPSRKQMEEQNNEEDEDADTDFF